ncbi:MAG: helix-turn-helix transcriptional regulator [Oscillospiraceae bacterium]|jgi:AraC-like DNA-binding protein|nr:helix-turn-helix transcriptional regulator [Oscillospiraceae bacterium]
MNRFAALKKIHGHRYFKQIFCISVATLIIVDIIASVAYYSYVSNTAVKNKYKSDMQMLAQVERNFEFIHGLLTNYCTKVYSSRAAANIMQSAKTEDSWALQQENLRLISSDMASFAPYIHSVYIYDGVGKRCYGAYADRESAVIDIYFENTIIKYAPVTKLKPVLRKIRSNDLDTVVFEDVLSYFYYEDMDAESRFANAVIVNMQPEWLLDNLYDLNTAKQDWFLLMTADREFVSYNPAIPYDYLDDVKAIYYSTIMDMIKQGRHADMIPCRLGGERYMLSYISMEQEDFILYRIESYASVYEDVDHLRRMIIMISGLIVIMTLFFAVIMARRIYAPFDRLVQSVGLYLGASSKDRRYFDELGFLKDSCFNSANEILLLKNEIGEKDHLKYKYYLSQLLINSSSVSVAEINDIAESGFFNIDMRRDIVLIILKAGAGSKGESGADRSRGWLRNALGEYLGKNYVNDIVDLENGSVVALVNTHGHLSWETDRAALLAAIDDMRRHEPDAFSFSSIVSDPVTEFSRISQTYFDLQNRLQYSYIFGNSVTITPGLIASLEGNSVLNYPAGDEQNLLAGVRENKADVVAKYLHRIIEKLKKTNYNNMMISLVNLCNNIRLTLNEIQQERMSDRIDMFEINPLKFETIDDLESFLLDVIKSCRPTGAVMSKNRIAIEAAKSIITAQYADVGLSLAGIADMTKTSPHYLNDSFKSVYGCSISDYLMEYRIRKAAELIETTNESINAIMAKIGIDNKSTFYRRFKTQFGRTPKRYMAELTPAYKNAAADKGL